MFNKFVLTFSAVVCIASAAFAQKPCVTDEHYQKLLKQYPQLAEYEEQFDAQIKAQAGARTTAAGPDTATYDMPIVVHVIHDYGVENLSDNALYEAAAYWAVVYMKQNADTSGVIPPFVQYIGNPKIRLHLATKDPNGKPTKGIDRVQSYLTFSGGDQAKYNQWPQNEYVNIWLINQMSGDNAGAAAYAYFPGSAVYQPYYDGIIALYDYTDNTTKTIPHEMGHVLNLYHPWGNSNNPDVACGDDHVDDTPPTKGHLPSGCAPSAIYDTACATGYVKTYTSVLSGIMDSVVNYPDTTNAQNIMDYTYCQEMFTIGQTVRMRTALTSATAGRNNLITPANLAATGALAPMPDLRPVADFIMNKANGGGAVTDSRTYFMTFNNVANFAFRNESWNDTVSGVSWLFSNGASTPTSTSTTTVYNKFATPGWVSVSLVATSNAGNDTLTKTQAVYAADTTVAGGMSYGQNFASASAISNWPMFNYYNNQFKWEFYNGAGYGDNSCVRYRSYDTSDRITGTAQGDHDDFFTPAFNLINSTGNVYLNFYTAGAYTRRNLSGVTIVNDSMEIDASTSGGVRWNKIAGYNSAALTNNGVYNNEFIPTSASQWVAKGVNVPAAYLSNNTFFRFRYWPGNGGNNLYLDNFAISPFPAGVEDVVKSGSIFSVFPNPASNGCKLIFKTGNDGVVTYTIKDITGKVVFQEKKEYTANSLQKQEVPRSATQAAGMYFVTLVNDGVATTQKLVVY